MGWKEKLAKGWRNYGHWNNIVELAKLVRDYLFDWRAALLFIGGWAVTIFYVLIRSMGRDRRVARQFTWRPSFGDPLRNRPRRFYVIVECTARVIAQ